MHHHRALYRMHSNLALFDHHLHQQVCEVTACAYLLHAGAAYDTGYGGTYDPSAWGQNGHTQSASTSSAWDGGAKTSQTAPPVVKAVGADEVSSHDLNLSS